MVKDSHVVRKVHPEVDNHGKFVQNDLSLGLAQIHVYKCHFYNIQGSKPGLPKCHLYYLESYARVHELIILWLMDLLRNHKVHNRPDLHSVIIPA